MTSILRLAPLDLRVLGDRRRHRNPNWFRFDPLLVLLEVERTGRSRLAVWRAPLRRGAFKFAPTSATAQF